MALTTEQFHDLVYDIGSYAIELGIKQKISHMDLGAVLSCVVRTYADVVVTEGLIDLIDQATATVLQKHGKAGDA